MTTYLYNRGVLTTIRHIEDPERPGITLCKRPTGKWRDPETRPSRGFIPCAICASAELFLKEEGKL